VSIEIKPPATAQAGQYPIKMQASAGDAKGEIELMVVLTGTYKLDAGTTSGLLSLDARQGQPSNIPSISKIPVRLPKTMSVL